MFTLLCAISIQILKFFCKDRRLLLYMSRTLHLFGTDWCAMMVPIQVIRWYRMQCYDGTDSCATVVPIRRYCHSLLNVAIETSSLLAKFSLVIDGFCFIVERMACCRSFTGSFTGSFCICKVNLTCKRSGCSNHSGLSQCFSFQALSMRGKPEPRFSPKPIMRNMFCMR